MTTAEKPPHSPLLAGLLLAAGGAFWLGILFAAGGGNAFFRAITATIVVLTLATLASLPIASGRATGETIAWVLLGVDIALALLTLFSLAIFGWIPVVLTLLAIDWWPRRPRERAVTARHLIAHFLAFGAVLAALVVTA